MVDKESWRKGAVQCASGARELLKDVMVAAQDAENASEPGDPKQRMAVLTERLALATGALFAIQEAKVTEGRAIRGKLIDAHHALEKAAEQLAELGKEIPALANGHQDRVARALALVFAAGGKAGSSAPPPRRSSTGIQAVRLSDPALRLRSPTSISSPTIELGEIEAATLGDLGVDVEPESHRPKLRAPTSVSSPQIQAVEVEMALSDLPPEEAALFLPPSSEPGVPSSDKRPSAAFEAVPKAQDATEPTESERRGGERVILEVDVGFVTESNFYAGLSMDVSEGGLFVATYQARPVGTGVLLSFVLPDGKTVTTAGVVRWVRDPAGEEAPGMGVEFSDLSRSDLSAIQSFCRRRQPLYYDDD